MFPSVKGYFCLETREMAMKKRKSVFLSSCLVYFATLRTWKWSQAGWQSQITVQDTCSHCPVTVVTSGLITNIISIHTFNFLQTKHVKLKVFVFMHRTRIFWVEDFVKVLSQKVKIISTDAKSRMHFKEAKINKWNCWEHTFVRIK